MTEEDFEEEKDNRPVFLRRPERTFPPIVDKNTLGYRVMKRRTEKGYSQRQLAMYIQKLRPDISGGQGLIHAIESGRSKNPTILYELAQILEVTPEYLKTGQHPKAENNPFIEKELTDNILSAVHGSYLMLGLSEDEASALLELVREVATEPPLPGAEAVNLDLKRLLAQSATRKFLSTRRS